MVWSLVSRERMRSKRNARLYRPCIIHSQPVLELSALFLVSLCYFPQVIREWNCFNTFFVFASNPFFCLCQLIVDYEVSGRLSTFQKWSCLVKNKLLMLHHHEIFWGLNSFTRDLSRGRAIVNMCLAQSFETRHTHKWMQRDARIQ
jgi:hypothetical protein